MSDKFRPLKNAFGRFATGVSIASCPLDGGGHAAITVNSFTSVALDPPLVLWCLETRASSFTSFMAADCYGISVLNAGQQTYSERFARQSPTPLAADEMEIWETGSPILKDRLAAFDCRIHARHKAGDHVILVGEVLRFDSAAGNPLVYFASNYHSRLEEK